MGTYYAPAVVCVCVCVCVCVIIHLIFWMDITEIYKKISDLEWLL